jgi:ATP-dependent 26S proteasome regulatory subunit
MAKPNPLASHDKLVNLLFTGKKTPEQQAKMVFDIVMGGMAAPETLLPFLTSVFQQAQSHTPEAEVAQLKAKWEEAMAELENGPARPATFICEAEGEMPGPKPRAFVITPDGQERYPIVREHLDIKKLRPGMTVYLDGKGITVLGSSNTIPRVGQQASFMRRFPESDQIEVAVRDEKLVVNAAQSVLDAEEEEKLTRGDRLLICPRRQFAFRVIPPEQDRTHRFVDRNQMPDVIASRDIGKPHWCLGYMTRRTRILLFRKDLLKRFDLRPRFAVLMDGPTGTGKTLTIRAFLHEFGKMLKERTGRDDLGSRVIRVKVSELLSEWLGRSDKNIEELFDDIKSIASEEVETSKGEKMLLPVVVILEEVEGLARRRGEQDGSGVYDRIIGTLLQRLDDPTEDLGKLPLILIATSNRPDLIDSAMWRRLAGIRARFTRLDREGLAAVLSKKLKPHYPFASRNGTPAEDLRRDLIDQIVAWLYSPAGEDKGLIEITLRDGKKLTKHRRDFLTGAVLEQAVSNAIDQTVFTAAEAGENKAGLNASALIDALRRHTDGLADNLTAHNIDDYVDMPEHSHAVQVRRLRSSSGQLADLIAEEH